MQRGIVALFFCVALGCSASGEGSDEGPVRCDVEEAQCPPGTRPMSILNARAQGYERVELEELGILEIDGLAYRRLEDEEGCAYACVQEFACPQRSETCFHGACFACLPPGIDLCQRECTRF